MSAAPWIAAAIAVAAAIVVLAISARWPDGVVERPDELGR